MVVGRYLDSLKNEVDPRVVSVPVMIAKPVADGPMFVGRDFSSNMHQTWPPEMLSLSLVTPRPLIRCSHFFLLISSRVYLATQLLFFTTALTASVVNFGSLRRRVIQPDGSQCRDFFKQAWDRRSQHVSLR